MPKLEPTSPVQVQFWSAAFVHLAVAVAPTFRHVIEADAEETARDMRVTAKKMTMFTVELSSADDIRKNGRDHRLKYSIQVSEICLLGELRLTFGLSYILGTIKWSTLQKRVTI